MTCSDTLHWPEGLDADRFLAEHWQQKHLWMPAALPGFSTPLSPDELAGLALEEGIASRLMTRQSDGSHTLEHGPFETERFAELEGQSFSLLVPDVDKHVPQLADWLAPFDFLPGWRMDDLMVSYAPDGGSVGAHTDAYDVFLLQASGTREWLIDSQTSTMSAEDGGSPVGQLAEFTPNESRVLEPGDLLYLPPGVPHHGIARGDNCTTWSIGFRAPSQRQLVHAIAERLAETLSDQPLPDPALVRTPNGQISQASLASYRAAWRRAVDLGDTEVDDLLGSVLTAHGDVDDPQNHDADHNQDHDPDHDPDHEASLDPDPTGDLYRTPWARLAWTGENDTVTLWANGERLVCSRALAIALNSRDGVTHKPYSTQDQKVLDRLLAEGIIAGKSGT